MCLQGLSPANLTSKDCIDTTLVQPARAMLAALLRLAPARVRAINTRFAMSMRHPLVGRQRC